MLAVTKVVAMDRKLRRAGDQRNAEHDQQHRGLGQRGDHHLARGADAAERRADIHAGERQGEPAGGEQRDDGDEIGGPGEHQVGRVGRHQRRTDPGGGEDEIRRGAVEPRGVVGEHSLLVQELPQIDVGLPQRRADPTQQARLDLARDAENERRHRQHQQHLHRLRDRSKID